MRMGAEKRLETVHPCRIAWSKKRLALNRDDNTMLAPVTSVLMVE
jgi:hypothetical protein